MPSGFDALYRRYRGFVRRALVRQHVRTEDLDDVAQEVFVVVWRKLEGDVDERALRAWLYEVTRRVASNHRRGRGRHARKLSRLSVEPCGLHPDAREAARQRLQQVADLVASLDPDQARIFDWVHLHGVPGRIVAARLGVKLHVAYAQIHALRRDLDAALDTSSREQRALSWLAIPWARWRWALLPVGAAAAAIALSRTTVAATPSPPAPVPEPPPSTHVAEPVLAYATTTASAPVETVRPRAEPPRPARPPRDERVRPSPVSITVPAAAPLGTFVKWIPQPRPSSTPTPTPTSVRASDDNSWRGRFVDEHGRPLAHARVLCRRRIAGRRRPCFPRGAAPHTDAEGRVRVGPLAPGTYELLAMPVGASTTGLALTRIRIDGPVRDSASAAETGALRSPW